MIRKEIFAIIIGLIYKNFLKTLTRIKSTSTENRVLLLFIMFVFFSAYTLPVIIYPMPTGTDVYTHMFFTDEISHVNSLEEFYMKCTQKEYVACDYPFGLWLFGSILSKVTGITTFELSYLLPIITLIVTILIFYDYSSIFTKKRKVMLLSVLFLISMPNISIAVLGYTPSVFTIPILLSILYFTLKDNMNLIKRVLIVELFVFCLIITHTGTFIFLLSFVMVFLLTSALLLGEFKKYMFILLFSLLLTYTISMSYFPHVQSQYIDKSSFFTTVGNFLSERTGLTFIGNLSDVFFQRVFVQNSMIDAILWAALFYIIVESIIIVRTEIMKFLQERVKFLASLPIVSNIANVSHSVIYTPFWIGPLQSLFSVFGLFKLNKVGLCILISAIFILLTGGGLHEGATGALRQIFYFLIIIPITSALGFEYLTEKMKKSGNKKIGKLLFTIVIFLTFFTIIILPSIGNSYYRLQITGTDYEINGMKWLSNIGTENEGVSGYGYRHMISVYSNKFVPEATTVPYGTQTRRLLNDLKAVYFTNNSEMYSDDIYSTFDIKYLISSGQVVKNLGGGKLSIDTAKTLDKIYSTKNEFSIYRHTFSVYSTDDVEEFSGDKTYVEKQPLEVDRGLEYEVETDYYRIVVGKTKPTISYLGASYNYIEDGDISDYLSLSWSGGPYDGKDLLVKFSDLNYSYSPIENNKIIYRSTIKNDEGEEWATLLVEYTFYQRSVKKEFIIANDYINHPESTKLYAILKSSYFSPMNYFNYHTDGNLESRRVYSSDDSIKLDDIFSDIFINSGREGILIGYGKTSEYPDEIIYKGSTLYNYSSISLVSRKFIEPSDTLDVTQFISVGDEKTVRNSQIYNSVSLLPYPDGEIPIVIVGYTDDPESLRSSTYISNFEMKTNGTYTLGIPMSGTGHIIDSSITNHEFLFYSNVYDVFSKRYKTYSIQKNDIAESKNNAEMYIDENPDFRFIGFIPNSMKYDLDTIDVLDKENINLFVGTGATSPFFGYHESGLRYPRFAYYEGEKSDIVILPVSLPTSSLLSSYLDTEETIKSWESTIDAAAENDEMCLFLWNPESLFGYEDGLFDVLNYAESKGLVFRKPSEISNHFNLIQNISMEISKDLDSATIRVYNGNDVKVDGVAFRVVLPEIELKCPYKTNAKLVRIERREECNIYLSEDIDAGEKITIFVESNTSKNIFNITLDSNIENNVRLSVTDSTDMPVRHASIFVNGKLYETDNEGTVNINEKRGSYILTAEKPGFVTKNEIIEIKGRFYSLNEISYETYIFSLIIAILLIVVYVFRRVLYGHVVDKTKRSVHLVKKVKSSSKKKMKDVSFWKRVRKRLIRSRSVLSRFM